MAAWKLAPALACGNTCVLKPAETLRSPPSISPKFSKRQGYPMAWVNFVTGPGETGSALVNHPNIDKIAFTGSTEVGKRIASVTVGTKKKLTLELGGKAANIIFEDAPIDQAVEGIIAGFILIRAMFAVPVRVCSSRKAFSQASSQLAGSDFHFARGRSTRQNTTLARSIRDRNWTRFANWWTAG